MKVCLYRCYAADHRVSMDIYADALQASLEAHNVDVRNFKPESRLEKFQNNKVLMRYLRYRRYSSAVRTAIDPETDVQHVVDHGYAHLLPFLKGGKTVVTVHDLIPLLTWKGIIETDDVPTRKPVLNLHSLDFLSRFDQIIAPSQSTANDLQSYLGINRSRIQVVPPCLDDRYQIVSDDLIRSFRAQHGLDDQYKWVMLSGSEFYKNHKTGLQVYKELLAHTNVPIKLVKSGRHSKEFDRLLSEQGLSGNVKQLYLDDVEDMPLLYGAVDCLLFPSLYEGFGMPVAEALGCGLPVVTSNRGSLEEVGGSLTPALEPFDIQGLAKAVEMSLSGSGLQKAITETGPAHVRAYRSNVVGEKMKKVYQSLISRTW